MDAWCRVSQNKILGWPRRETAVKRAENIELQLVTTGLDGGPPGGPRRSTEQRELGLAAVRPLYKNCRVWRYAGMPAVEWWWNQQWRRTKNLGRTNPVMCPVQWLGAAASHTAHLPGPSTVIIQGTLPSRTTN